MNKVGIYYGYWSRDFDADYVAYAKKVAGLGFDVIELGAEIALQHTGQENAELRAVSRDLGLELVFAVDPPEQYDVSDPDPLVRERAVDYMTRYFRLMEKLGSATGVGIVNGIWNAKMVDTKEAHLERSVETMKKLASVAADHGITLCMEIVNRYEQFMINTGREAIRYIEQAGCPNLKIQFDTFHMNIEEDSFRGAILEARGYLGYIHLGENNRRPVGRGFLPWGEIFGALKEIGYTGMLTLEPLIQRGGEMGNACSIWREIMPGANLDDEAVRAQAFVRSFL